MEQQYPVVFFGIPGWHLEFESNIPEQYKEYAKNGNGNQVFELLHGLPANDFQKIVEKEGTSYKLVKDSYNCNTEKQTPGLEKKKRGVYRLGAISIFCWPDGIISSVFKNWRAESLTQLWIHHINLVLQFPQMNHRDMYLAFDDFCHYWDFKRNSIRPKVLDATEIVAEQKGCIENLHLKNHKCKDEPENAHFLAENHEELKTVSTGGAEHIFRWFSLYRTQTKSMSPVVYDLFILGILHKRNKWQLKRLRAAKYIN